MENIKRDGVMEDAMEKVKAYGHEQYQNGWKAGRMEGARDNMKLIGALETSLNALDYSIELYENVIAQLKEVANTMKEYDHDRYNEGFQTGLDEAKMNCQEEIEALRHELIRERNRNRNIERATVIDDGIYKKEDDTPKSKTIIFNVDKISLSEDDDE